MFVGVESCDKICHTTVHARKTATGVGLRADPAGELIKSGDTEEVESQILQINTDYWLLAVVSQWLWVAPDLILN